MTLQLMNLTNYNITHQSNSKESLYLLGLNWENWKELSKDKKKLVQDYNAKVKHGEDTKHLLVPPGLTIKIKSCPRRRQELDDDLVEEKKDDPDQPPKKKTKKSISFPLESEWHHVRPRNLSKSLTNQDILIVDTRRAKLGTITNRVWKILSTTNNRTVLNGYQDKGKPQVFPIVNAATKVMLDGLDEPIIVILNYVTLVSDPNETKSLLQPFSLMPHGADIDMTPKYVGRKQQITVEDKNMPLKFDGKKLFFNITKPTHIDMETLELF